MFYTPKFCNECGTEIEQDNVKILPSRFCETCEPNYKMNRYLPAIWMSAALIAMIFSFGYYLKAPVQPVGLLTTPANSANKNQNSSNQANSQVITNSNVQLSAQKTEANNFGGQINQPILTTSAGQKSLPAQTKLSAGSKNATEPVYICGAQTKKGTACLRRVKGGGRCWQHLGQPAILPAEKLLVSR